MAICQCPKDVYYCFIGKQAGFMENIREILAKNMKLNRRKIGLTQATLAEKADITTQYIAMIEVCKKFPTPEILERIAKALEIETYQLFSADPTIEAALERLYQTVAGNIEQIVAEAIQKVLADSCKGCQPLSK
jgi:transcriptional regulator with XRE-family HTH domain